MHEVVVLDGGLGNNLFQLHHAWTLKNIRKSTRVALHALCAESSAEQRFLDAAANELGLEMRHENSALDKMVTRIAQVKRTLSERGGGARQRNTLTVTRLPSYRLHCGYWQSIPFFPTASNLFDDTIASLLEDGSSDRPILHIRGGDYLSRKNAGIYAMLDMNYYRQAFQEVESRLNQVHYEVVTNDPLYVERMLSTESRAFELSHGKSAMDDFAKLSRHKVIVATNSTFCWWAARIGFYKGQTDLIIAPAHWLNEGYRHRSHPRYAGPEDRVVVKSW